MSFRRFPVPGRCSHSGNTAANLVLYAIIHEKSEDDSKDVPATPIVIIPLRQVLRDIFGSPLSALILIWPFALLANSAGWNHEVTFCLNFLGIIPVSQMLGLATEDLAVNLGTAVGGMVSAFFGNAVEFLLTGFALRDGLVDMVQFSLLGSILSNLLFVVGSCFLLGGIQHHYQTFNSDAARVQSNLLLLSVFALAMPSLRNSLTIDEQLWQSHILAFILSTLYVFYLVFQLKTHAEIYAAADKASEGTTSMHPLIASVLLLVATLLATLFSNNLVACLGDLSRKTGIPDSFTGLIILPMVGNVAEHWSAVTVARKDKMDLSLAIALGSSLHVALLIVPCSVLMGWVMDVPMNLCFSQLGTLILFISLLVLSKAIGNGCSNWLQGAILLGAYSLIAIGFWFTH